MKTQGPPKLFRFAPGKIGHDHGDLQHLLLEQRHPERPGEHRLESRIKVSDFFAPGASIEIGMDHVALDWPWPDDGDLDHDVVKTFRLHSRQRRHLGAAFDLEYADRVRFLHHFVGGGVVGRNMGEIDRPAAFPAKLERILHHRHHPEPQQIHLHDAEIFAVVLVPLRDDAAGHGGIFERAQTS